MNYRANDLEIPSEDPYRHDMLERRQLVEFLSRLIKGLDGPFVIALDSPFGSGKTTLIHMLIEDMKKKCRCTYFNAWEVDYATDPLVALVSSIDLIRTGRDRAGSKYREQLKKVKETTAALAKPTLFALVKASTSGMLDIGELSKALASESTTNIVDQFTEEKRLLDTFREELTKAMRLLTTNEEGPYLIIFIDELDRCRPTFAIHLLERIKHVFNIPNIVFVLAMDKKQIEASTKAVYGAEVNATEYLRRFFDLEYGIPVPDAKNFTDNLIARFNLDSLFDQRNSLHNNFVRDRQHFVGIFDWLANAMELSLRAREKCITRFRIVMEQTPDNQYLDPILVAFLIILRSNKPDLYGRIIEGHAMPEEVIDFLTSLPGGKIKKSDSHVNLIHAYLLVAFPNRELAKKWRIEKISASENGNGDRQTLSIVQNMHSIMGEHDRDISLVKVAKKIDLASWSN